jgi:drug/metabolite transporter (DMT)-like permease
LHIALATKENPDMTDETTSTPQTLDNRDAPSAPAFSFSPPVIAALAAVYFIWGSTWLAMRYAVQTLPPLLLESLRVGGAGTILYILAGLRGAPRPERAHWGPALIGGGLMLGLGEGASTWAVRFVPSGLASVLFATVPLWMVLFNWLWTRTERPGPRVTAGLVLGLGGIVLLVGPGQLLGGGQGEVNLLGAALLMLAGISFVNGSLYSRRARLPESWMQATAMQMLGAAALLVVTSLLIGEMSHLDLGTVSTRSVLSLAYLITGGSVVAFSAYYYLLRETTPALAASYAYVNPVVAVLIGWAVGGETLTTQALAASAIIIAAVVLITTQQRTTT